MGKSSIINWISLWASANKVIGLGQEGIKTWEGETIVRGLGWCKVMLKKLEPIEDPYGDKTCVGATGDTLFKSVGIVEGPTNLDESNSKIDNGKLICAIHQVKQVY